MASFNIRKGLEASLPFTKADGTMYFCTDTGNLYVDYKDGENLIRKLIDKSKFEELNLDINNLQNDLNTHKEDIIKHITSTERTKWNDAYDLANTAKATADEKAVVGTIEMNDTVARIKDVPADAAPYAKVLEIGGMTRKCTNLIPTRTTGTTNGVSSTVSDDGTITFSGTTAGVYNYYLYNYKLPAGSYYLSWKSSVVGAFCYVYNTTANKVVLEGDGKITLETESDVAIYITQPNVGRAISGSIRPMLNEGDTALPYEPYFEGLRSAPVTEVESVGVNLCDLLRIPDTLNGLTFTKNTGGTVTINGTANAYTTVYFDKIEIKTGEKFYHLGGSNGTTFTFNGHMGDAFIKNIGTADNTVVKTIECDGTYDSFYPIILIQAGQSFSNAAVRFIVSKTPFVSFLPYRRNTLPIPAEVQALDGYGWGTSDKVYNYIDFEKKQFVKRVERVDLGTLTWTFNNIDIFYAGIADKALGFANILCGKYPVSSLGFGDMANNTITGNETYTFVYIKDSTYTDVATFKVAMSGVMLYYELAEPVITDISDLLPDDNLISIEGGGTVTMVNEYGYNVPNKIEFYNGNNNILSANKFVGDLEGTATTATKLATARTISLTGDVIGSATFDGSANASIEATVADDSHNHIIDNIDGLQNVLDSKANFEQWDCTITCATWSRLCHVACGISIEGAKFILNIAATRNSVVYNDTFIITAHHSGNGKIIKIAGSNYSAGYKIRLLCNSNGDAYVELYDDCLGATNSTVENVNCRLIPIFSGIITKYTTFTDGTNVPSGYNVVQTMTTTNDDLQGNLGGTARYAVYEANSGAPLIHTGNIGSQSVNYATSAGSASSATKATQDSNGNVIASTYLPKSGGTMTGTVTISSPAMSLSAGKVVGLSAGTSQLYANGLVVSNPTTANDVGWLRVTGTGESDTIFEIATGDDGGKANCEKIVARQYDTNNNVAKEAVLLNIDGTTSFPVSVTAPSFIGNASSATKATQDSSGNIITSTYATKTELNSKLSTSGGSLSGAITINKTAADKTTPVQQDLVLNYSLPSGGTLTEKNAPGIGFHIGNVNWANLLYDGTFKFANNNFTGYAPVKASSFTGALKGNADTATKATQDASGNTITSTYATKTELTNGLAGKANTSHTHTKSQITDFPSSLPASDVYSWAKASSKPSYSWNEITSKPSTFTPASHTHDDRYYTESEINNLVNGRAPAYQYSTTDLTAGSSSLTTGTLYFVYE